MVSAIEARRLTQEANKKFRVEREVNNRIIAAAKEGWGWIKSNSDELALIKDILVKDGYSIIDNNIVWGGNYIVTPDRKDDYEEGEW